MPFYVISTLLGLILFAVISHGSPITNVNDAAMYLRRFGYIEESSDQGSLAITDQETVSSAIKEFQKFAGLRQTGVLDTQTRRMMNVPRCGRKDKSPLEYSLGGSKWNKEELTYHISNFPTRPFNIRRRTDEYRPSYKDEIVRAFKVWSDVANINFKEKPQGSADIEILFGARRHRGCDSAFDGTGGTLAHATLPQDGGDAHFDDDETWSIQSIFGTNLFQVAAHEFGHSLGLLHSEKDSALMAPFYTGYKHGFQLHSDDVAAIQAIYGPRHASPAHGHDGSPDESDAPNLCQDGTIDTITRVQSGSTFVFKGNYYWKVISTGGIASGYPRKISDDWNGLEGNLDASVTLPNGKTYFFKMRRVWRFTNTNKDSGYPKLISEEFPGIPSNLDAAFVWGKNSKTYFFKGNHYWRFDFGSNPPVDSAYPEQISAWSRSFSSGIQAALQWENGRSYFFKGNQYYRYNDEREQVDDNNPPYPLPTASLWFGCV